MNQISIIIPTLDEADTIRQTLQPLQALRQAGHEVIIVDGGSQDHTVDISMPMIDKFIQTNAGRALQMNSGAQLAKGNIFLFLHADTHIPENADELILSLNMDQAFWGRFDVRFTHSSSMFKLVARCMNLRSAISGIVTGDHSIFIHRTLFEHIQGFPEIPLMEDIAISRKLLKHSRPICIKKPVTTSSRRWEKHGIIKTILLMWYLRLQFFLGAAPEKLARIYYPNR